MNGTDSFEFWRQRISATADPDELARIVEDAIEAMVPRDKVSADTYAELAGLVLQFISRKDDDLETQKERALKALAPFAQLGPAAERGDEAAAEAEGRIEDAPPPPAAKKKRPAKKPKATARPGSAATPEPAAAAAMPLSDDKFNRGFTDAMCTFIRRKLDPFQIPPGGSPLPFILSAEFGACFEQAVRAYVVPPMLENRRIKLMAQSMNEEDINEHCFMTEFARPDKENVARFLWGDRWDEIRMALTASQKGDRKKDEKTGIIDKLIGKKDKKPARPRIDPRLEADAKALWKQLQGDGAYDPPKVKDIVLFETLFDYVPAKIQSSMRGAEQILRQEAEGGVDSREGAARQYLAREMTSLPAHCGELVALWAYYARGDSFTPKILKSFLASQGTTTRERQRYLPFFLRWVPDVVAQSGSLEKI